MNSDTNEAHTQRIGEIEKPFRVLCIDGGGMRGIYSAAYLNDLQSKFALQRGLHNSLLDIGKGFDLVVGTSTGAIIALGLADRIPCSKILALYKKHGKYIFPLKLPDGKLETLKQLLSRPAAIKSGDAALENALESVFGDKTLGKLYSERNIAIAIPAIDMSTHNAWVFKSAHLENSNHRDDDYRLVDVCKATSAAPIFRSLAAIDNPDNDSFRVFADGGLYANSPVMVGLIEAIQLTTPGQEIEIFGLGTCKPVSGEHIAKKNVHRGLAEWKAGGKAAELSIDAQEEVAWQMARLLIPHIDRTVHLVRFPRGDTNANTAQYLDLDETRSEAADALCAQAYADVNGALSRCADQSDEVGVRLKVLMNGIPELHE